MITHDFIGEYVDIFIRNTNSIVDNCLIKQFIAGLFLLLGIVHFAFAGEIDDMREQAKLAYFSGEIDKALPSFLKASETGDAESQYYLGLIYLTDDWSGKDINKAASYLKTAADQNNTDAMWKLGELYENGQGVDTDLLAALDWYRKSKQLETLKSGIKFINVNNGNATFQSNSEVIGKIKSNALKGKVEAQFKLANIYDEGKFSEKDAEKAFYWYQTAAKNNHSYSMLITGYLLCRGIGVELNKKEANQWIVKSGRKANCY